MADCFDLYSNCTLCPNKCHVNRLRGQRGRCGQTDEIRIAWCGLHKGEEPPVSGEKGSGMIFFCGCPLHCQYCQNYQISRENTAGITVSQENLTRIMLELQKAGAASLNLVTGTHYVPSIIKSLKEAEKQGFSLPVVWNSSGFETVETLRLIDPYIDLYLIDVKTLSCSTASKFCGLERYAADIIPVMRFLKTRHRTTDLEGKINGVLVRHLVFPGELESTFSFLKWYSDNFKDCFKLSMMVQFVPPENNPGFEKMTDKEYSHICKLLDEYDIDGFIQEQDENEILWIPDFTKNQPFPEGFATPLDFFLFLKSDVTSE